MRWKPCVYACLCWFMAVLAPAQVPSLINYQGRLLNGTNLFNGTANFQMRFRTNAVPVVGEALLYQEDIAGTPVVDGLYSFRFGQNPTIGQLSTALAQSNLYLEVLVNGATLAPRERVSAVAYALVADGLKPAGLTSAMIATGAIQTAHLALRAVGSNQLAIGAVQTTNLANGAVGTAHIQNGAVAAQHISYLAAWKMSGNTGTTAGTHFIGTADNEPLEIAVNGRRAFRLEPSSSPRIIMGHNSNTVTGAGSVIGGGGSLSSPNKIEADYGVVAGGTGNSIGDDSTTAVIGGGTGNVIGRNSTNTVIAGGQDNLIGTNSIDSTIGGGWLNEIHDGAPYATIGGGRECFIEKSCTDSMIGGGRHNYIRVNATNSTIAGGAYNAILSNATFSTVGGGLENIIYPYADYAVIGGGNNNDIQRDADYAVIAGGTFNIIEDDCVISTIGGGAANGIGAASTNATIAGGQDNDTGDHCPGASIGGGYQNKIGDGSGYGTIAGGYQGNLGTNCRYSVISGGQNMRIFSDSAHASIGGGYSGTILSNCSYSTMGGGSDHMIGPDAEYATIAGGQENEIRRAADGGTIGGGMNNTVSGPGSTVPGGVGNTASGQCSFAAGYLAQARHNGSFAWQDSFDAYDVFSSTSSNQFLINAHGGVGIMTNHPEAALHVGTDGNQWNLDAGEGDFKIGTSQYRLKVGVATGGGGAGDVRIRSHGGSSRLILGSALNDTLTVRSNYVGIGTINPTHRIEVTGGAYCDGGDWVNGSDRNSKTDIQPVDPRQVLDRVASLPISEWSYKQDQSASRHMGPMAQDFHEVFNLGNNDKAISTVDPSGVALAAIQGLYDIVKEQQARIEKLEKENATLKAGRQM
jgi:hypothetical protein